MRAINIGRTYIPFDDDLRYSPQTVDYVHPEVQAALTEEVRTECARSVHGMRADTRARGVGRATKGRTSRKQSEKNRDAGRETV